MSALAIVEFAPELAGEFEAINAEWIEAMFSLEPTDRAVLSDPVNHVIAPGGVILFVRHDTLGIIGTCALKPSVNGTWELTKMGVRASARGQKAGQVLLHAMLDRAAALPIDLLYLLTSSRCAAAIHLYEKAGWMHDAAFLSRFGASYQRCDVAMSFDLASRRTTNAL